MTNLKSPKPRSDDSLEGFSATVDSFASRIKRKMKEQRDLEEENRQASSARHGLMLQAIALCRKALQETSKISLGSRFTLDLHVDDFESWPRIELCLVDGRDPSNRDCCLLISAHDRNDLGAVVFSLRSGEFLGQVHLCNEGESARLPLLLKKSIRVFLDVVAAAVLDRQQAAEEVVQEPLVAEDPEMSVVDVSLRKENLFAEELRVGNMNVLAPDEEPPAALVSPTLGDH